MRAGVTLVAGLVAILALAFALRLHGIGAGLPYFYDEDEAHHLNRTVQMFKSGDLNPRYFHKPSLHFYLRLPATAAAYWLLKQRGAAHTTQDLRTRDRWGIGDYAFTASHSGVVKANRLLSVLWSLAVVLLTALIGYELFAPTQGRRPDKDPGRAAKAALFAALLTAISPGLIAYSSVVGVDMLMTMFGLAAVYVALILYRRFSPRLLILCGLLCGLAISSKYNAAPVAVLPLVAAWAAGRLNRRSLAIALLVPPAGFLLGSPYIVISLPLFWEHLSYEVWHYAVAGHAGNSGPAGLPQLLFYLNWLGSSALGWGITILGLFGITLLVRRDARRSLVAFIFPLLYVGEMALQKTNFVRNMLIAIPFLSLGTAAYFLRLTEIKFSSGWIGKIIIGYSALVILVQPLNAALRERSKILERAESRSMVDAWIAKHHHTPVEIAIAGNLLLPPAVYRRPGVSVFDAAKLDLRALYLDGFELVVLPTRSMITPSRLPGLELFTSEQVFPGSLEAQRIVANPAVTILRAVAAADGAEILAVDTTMAECAHCRIRFDPDPLNTTLRCSAPPSTEDYCWTTTRVGLLSFPPNARASAISLSLMSPWPGQQMILLADKWRYSINFKPEDTGHWKDVSFEIPRGAANSGELRVLVKENHSPQQLRISTDPRRLGVAIRSFAVVP